MFGRPVKRIHGRVETTRRSIAVVFRRPCRTDSDGYWVYEPTREVEWRDGERVTSWQFDVVPGRSSVSIPMPPEQIPGRGGLAEPS